MARRNIRAMYLECWKVKERLKWAARTTVLDADTALIETKDALLERSVEGL